MFGTFRFFLATLVAVSHLTPPTWLRYIGIYCGFYAVFGFYCVSGYLMTAVLQSKYGYGAKGSLSFLINRTLRIFPSYYAVAAATFIVIGVFSDQAALYAPVYKISLHALDILGNTLLFPFEFYQSKFRLIPPAWSLGVEILAYFLLWLFISRGKRQSIITLAISLVYVAYTFIAGLKGVDRYFPLYAALLPFSVGALIYHYLTEIKNALVKLPRYATPFSILALLAHLVLAGKISKYPLGAGLYVNLALMAFIIAQLAVVQNAAGFIKKMDIFLGNLSYPVFLTHSLAGFITSLIFPSYAQFDFPIVLMIGYPLAIVLSIFIGKYIDEPINVWRDKFRKSP